MGEKRVPAPLWYAVLVIALVVITIVAFALGAEEAARGLALLLLGLGVARAVLPAGTVLDIRGRIPDTITLVALGCGLYYLADWGSAIPVG